VHREKSSRCCTGSIGAFLVVVATFETSSVKLEINDSPLM
jgi:hypothetical protein